MFGQLLDCSRDHSHNNLRLCYRLVVPVAHIMTTMKSMMNTDADNEIENAEVVVSSGEMVCLGWLVKLNENLESIVSLGVLNLVRREQASYLSRGWTVDPVVPM